MSNDGIWVRSRDYVDENGELNFQALFRVADAYAKRNLYMVDARNVKLMLPDGTSVAKGESAEIGVVVNDRA